MSPLAPADPQTSLIASASLLSQLPQIPRFNGQEEQADGETFLDWLEQFESVAVLGDWNDHYKLVHLTTKLRGAAYSFYRSCSPTQRSSYALLVEELKKRFTPVKLAAVQSQLFHDRQQGPKESVDEFAQDLRKLFAKAYAGVSRGGPEAEKMGQSVLANQFIGGLHSDLKAKVVGVEGSLEQLLLKARFEEAKKRELKGLSTPNQKSGPTPQRRPQGYGSGIVSEPRNPPGRNPQVSGGTGQISCFKCGMAGHIARFCPYSKQQKNDGEAKGKKDGEAKGKKGASVASVRSEGEAKTKVDDLRRQLQEAEVAAAVEGAAATVHGVRSDEGGGLAELGPTITAPIKVNGMTTKALVDTGSPVTIASLAFMMKVLLQEREQYATAQDWSRAIRPRLETPSVTLRSYGGGRLNVVAQIKVVLSQGTHRTDAMVLVQKDAPCELLLGTDAQSAMGLSLLLKQGEKMTDLLAGGEPSTQASHDPDKPAEEQTRGEPDSPQGKSLNNVPVGQKPVGIVKLLQATRIPAHFRKMVRVVVDGTHQKDLSLITPTTEDPALVMVDAVIQCEGGNCATVLVENHGDTPMKLGKGMMLGNVEPVELVAEGEEELENQEVVSVVEAGPTGEEVVTGQVSAVEAGPTAGEE